ncbi:MAG: hypothetical protein IJA81_01455 [Akkermansia sp.]|nr:hypothetical protein [Akkermansia sp.]
MNMLRNALLVALGASVAPAAEIPQNLGNVMFVGDSITHGFGTPSYRWPLHKILVDNGVKYNAVGVTEGNQNPRFCVNPGTLYAGVAFNNRHSAMSSERAYEIAGRINSSGRLGNSNIADWLGLDASYQGKFKLDMPTQTPDLVVMMIGTNDTFGDYGNKGGVGAGDNMLKAQNNLIGSVAENGTWSGTGDLDVIVDSLRKVNPRMRIIILPIPTWHDARRNNNKADDFAALMAYNENLKKWADAKKLEFVDINEVLVNPSREDKPGVAEVQFFHAVDRLHPTVQGDLLIAAKVAEALGVPGRTVGLPRKAVADFTLVTIPTVPLTRTTAAPLPQISCPTFTASVNCSVGNGATEGWVTNEGLRFTMGNGENTGVITVTESSVLWGEKADKVLYCADMSANQQELRVAYVTGDAATGYTPGFYVWLGEHLIGEALPGMAPELNGHVKGVFLSRRGTPEVRVKHAAVESGAYAPSVAE